jgi:hypothetical protein
MWSTTYQLGLRFVARFRAAADAGEASAPDNLKSGVNKASFYDPEINRTYGAMAAHCGVGVLTARPRKPRDKAKFEAGVRFTRTYMGGGRLPIRLSMGVIGEQASRPFISTNGVHRDL